MAMGESIFGELVRVTTILHTPAECGKIGAQGIRLLPILGKSGSPAFLRQSADLLRYLDGLLFIVRR